MIINLIKKLINSLYHEGCFTFPLSVIIYLDFYIIELQRFFEREIRFFCRFV